MGIFALGINHKTAPVEIREKVAFTPERLSEALRALTAQNHVTEAAILSTCNRTEIYCGVEGEDSRPVLDWFSDFHKLNASELEPYFYAHPDRQAVRHMLRVASGLDSLVLGEPQILGQMKQAFTTAHEAGTVGQLLNRLFQHTFSVAKQIFSDMSRHTALLIGAGETIELVARHLHETGIGRIIVANRTVERAHNLAAEFGGYAIALPEIPNHLAEADIVISSTASPLPILGKGAVESALKARKHRPMLMVDIAVPRDIEAEVRDLEDVYLYTVDDLQEIIQEGLRSRQEAALQAEEIIDVQVGHFMGWLKSLESVDLIRRYRISTEQQRDQVVEAALRQLQLGRAPDEVLRELGRQLTNKLMHTPCSQMKQAGYDGRTELLSAARELFNLKTPEN